MAKPAERCENTQRPEAEGRLGHKISTGSMECRESNSRNLVNRLIIVENVPISWFNNEICQRVTTDEINGQLVIWPTIESVGGNNNNFEWHEKYNWQRVKWQQITTNIKSDIFSGTAQTLWLWSNDSLPVNKMSCSLQFGQNRWSGKSNTGPKQTNFWHWLHFQRKFSCNYSSLT